MLRYPVADAQVSSSVCGSVFTEVSGSTCSDMRQRMLRYAVAYAQVRNSVCGSVGPIQALFRLYSGSIQAPFRLYSGSIKAIKALLRLY